MQRGWTTLKPPTEALFEARLQLHWALQSAAAVSRALVPAAEDDSHTSFAWVDELKALVSKLTPEGFRVGLRLEDISLLFLSADLQREFDLSDRTLDEGFRWFENQIYEVTEQAPRRALERPSYNMPGHPVASGKVFSASILYTELANWFADADALLSLYSAQEHASPVRCWPHHFDMATLLELAIDQEAKSVTFGMTPGDASYKEPYWYVSPWPYPETDNLPTLSNGNWHTKGWQAAVLKASAMRQVGQAAQVRAFMDEALDVSKTLLDCVVT